MQVGFLICDPSVEKPTLLKDKFWDEVIPTELAYTVGSQMFRAEEFKGSAEVTLEKNISDTTRASAIFHTDEEHNFKKRKYSIDTIYESIRTIRDRKKERLIDRVLHRDLNVNGQQDTFSLPGKSSQCPVTGRLSGMEVRDAFGLE